MLLSISTIVFTLLTGIVVLFQLCLAFGLPWGAASMGGKYPGKYPPKMRFIAIIIILILLTFNFIVISRAGYFFPWMYSFSKIAIWFVVLFSLSGTVMNSITPSKIERIWVPVVFLQLIASVIVALS
ncbi:hypothetical protein EW093_08485 [Thiospirochaeta perfilievii]|uniref:Uncharacterized protein n=1 Tax=Thiospirochaeta perfilievii TaxID=252967 RepID=A0A5C1Q9D2_9SPIO|nr:hypothetical protein [Thiospirochaeta perfilievii]QEN04743.1 hypothetical protein EW093_08485 [Thiospirochaeta perfilievii]